MRVLVVSIVAAVLAGQVSALSCMRPDISRDYKQAAAAEESYVVVDGVLTFDERKLKPLRKLDNNHPAQTDIAARLTGKSLTRQGFSAAFERDITLRVTCAGPWCGGAQSGTRYLAFLEKTGDGYVMAANPCGGFSYAEPTSRQRKLVEVCFKGGHCRPLPNKR